MTQFFRVLMLLRIAWVVVLGIGLGAAIAQQTLPPTALEQHLRQSERNEARFEEFTRRVQVLEQLDLAQRLTRLEAAAELNGKLLIGILVAIIIQVLQAIAARQRDKKEAR